MNYITCREFRRKWTWKVLTIGFIGGVAFSALLTMAIIAWCDLGLIA